MEAPRHDPRVFFAAERTLLAWVRTGLAVMGMGFVVARFELHLSAIRGEPIGPQHVAASLIGALLVCLGSLAIGIAARQHVVFCRTLDSSELPARNLVGWSVRIAAALSFAGFLLALYIALRGVPTGPTA